MTPIEYISIARLPDNFPNLKMGKYNVCLFKELRPEEPFKNYRVLAQCNMAGLHKITEDGYGGDVIMEDSYSELKRHLPIWVHGKGRVLKTGLGMGCVVRGLLAKPDVEHIDVIEIEKTIIDVFGMEFENNPRVTIHHMDALSGPLPGWWDYAWHDIWCEGNIGLVAMHAKLVLMYYDRVKYQGAWAFPRDFKNQIRRKKEGHRWLG